MQKRTILGALLGAAAGAVATGVVVERRVARERGTAGHDTSALGSLRSEPLRVVTADGTGLYAEIDERAPYSASVRVARDDEPTLVFVHGYALNLDCWHYQRAAMRGRHRMVFFDQRSHGRSDASDRDHASIDQLGDDLADVLQQLVPDGPVILVSHSMGGMSVLAFAERHPDVFAERVRGVALIATAASDLRPHEALSGWIPDGVGELVALRAISALAKAPDLVDSARRLGSNVGYLVVRRFAFGGPVPAEQVEFLDAMLAETSMAVLGSFFPQFDALDKEAVLSTFGSVPTTVVCGTEDRLTPIRHSRAMAQAIEGAVLVECPGAGHLVIFEKAERVNRAIDDVVARATGTVLRAVE